MITNKYTEYNSFISEGLNITEGFELTSIRDDNYVMHKILSSDISKSVDNIFDFYLSFIFIYDNSYCLIVLLDNIAKGNFPFLDYWFDDIELCGGGDIMGYIYNSKRFGVYKFGFDWYCEKVSSRHICDMEIIMMKPVIRKMKIKNLLK